MKSKIIGKKQLLSVTLILAFGLSVYVNWYYTNNYQDLSEPETSDSFNLGEAQLVNSDNMTENKSDYFTQVKVNRSKAHDDAIQCLEDIISNKDFDEETISLARSKLVNISEQIKLESAQKINDFLNLILPENVKKYAEEHADDCMVRYGVNADGTLNDEGTAFKVTINSSITALNNKNTSTYTFQYKMSTSDSWTTVGTTLSGYAPNTNFVMTNIYLNIDTSYDFRLTVKDYFESVIKNVNVAESFTLINYSADGKGIAFGGVSEDSNAFDVKLDKMYFSNECFIGGAKRNDLEKNFYFQTREDAAIPSDCKIYGGNGSSSTSIGIWDVLNDIPVFRYFGPSKNFTFGEDINIRKGSLPLINQVVAVAAHNSGRIHYSNGLLIQWGIISITPTAANETTLVTITFPISYTYKPNCFVTPQTSAPTIQTLSIGQGSTTTTNFSIYMNRTNTTAITVHWLAVGYKEVT